MMANVPEYLAKHKLSDIFAELASNFCASEVPQMETKRHRGEPPFSRTFLTPCAGFQAGGSTRAALSSLTEELATPAKRDQLRARVHPKQGSPTARVVRGEQCATVKIDSVKPAFFFY